MNRITQYTVHNNLLVFININNEEGTIYRMDPNYPTRTGAYPLWNTLRGALGIDFTDERNVEAYRDICDKMHTALIYRAEHDLPVADVILDIRREIINPYVATDGRRSTPVGDIYLSRVPRDGFCNGCGDQASLFELTVIASSTVYIAGPVSSTMQYCDECYEDYDEIPHIAICNDCGDEHSTTAEEVERDRNGLSQLHHWRNTPLSIIPWYCDYCLDELITDCPSCETALWGQGACPDCSVTVHGYSWRPTPLFHPELPESSKQLYIGMELEVEYERAQPAVLSYLKKALPGTLDAEHPFFYLKTDSSIDNGVEIVTHPFSPLWGLKNIPWDGFDDLIGKGYIRREADTCGQHIHMSKDAFSSSHLWKLLQLHHRLPDFVSLIGGRNKVNRWGALAGDGWTGTRAFTKESAMQKRPTTRTPRYVGVNLAPEDTIELRYPSGLVTATGIRKNIQWAQVLHEFTDEITVPQVRNGVLDTPGALLWYIRNKRADFSDLNKYLDTKVPSEQPLDSFS